MISWDAFLTQPWQGPLLIVIAIIGVLAVADLIDGAERQQRGAKHEEDGDEGHRMG